MKNYFDNIRAFEDNDVKQVLEQLVHDQDFQDTVFSLPFHFQELIHKFNDVNTIRDFQTKVIYPFAHWIVDNTIVELTYSGLEYLSPDSPYLFISNHRDIVMDPLLINYILYRSNFPTTQIGIGNNLLIKPWIEKIVRLNKSFIVYRNLKGKSLLVELKRLSDYIRHTLLEKKESIWIAQREGRAKNGIDETQISLLKMLSLAFKRDEGEYQVVPVTFSYEFDPCDALKAIELSLACQGKAKKKSPADDLLHMKLGLLENKGRVHVHFDKPLTIDLPISAHSGEIIKQTIDEKIQKNFHCFSTHLYAYQKLFAPDFQLQNIPFEKAQQYFKNQMKKYNLTDDKERFLLLPYANTAKNYFSANDLVAK